MANIENTITVGEVDILEVDQDPSLGAGTSSPVGSLAIVQNETDEKGTLYQKTGPLDTDWTLILDKATADQIYLKVEALSSNISLYATTASSDIVGYNKLVTSLDDPDYDTVAVDVSTGVISSNGQLVGQLISEPGLIVGNPGIININTIGNIRKVSGSKFAEFYYEVYKRNSGGVETLIANSAPTVPVESTTYEQFFEFALLNNGIFTETDRLVVKYYANLSSTGNDPVYEFQFGGSYPVRTLLPVPVAAIPPQTAEETPVNFDQFNRFFSAAENNVQKALEKVDNTAVSKDGESAMNGALQWSKALSNGMNTEVYSSNIDHDDVTLTSQLDSNPVKSVQITSRYISHTDGVNPAVPTSDSHLVNKKWVDDKLDAKEDTSNKNSPSGYAGLDANSQILPSTLPYKVLAGPGVILQFSGSTFQQSGYVPGVGINSTPSDFGFYPVQNASFVFNPFQVLGANKNYRIYAIKRQDGALFDGVHCMIRKVENGVESGIPGLLDFGAGVNEYASATSDVLNSGNSDSFIWYRCYFAAYNGANEATLQDLTLWIVTE